MPSQDELLEKDGVSLLMLSLDSQPSLVQAVEESDQRCEQYLDRTAVIFARCESIQ